MTSPDPDGTPPLDPALARDLRFDRGGRFRSLLRRFVGVCVAVSLVGVAYLTYRRTTAEPPVEYRLAVVRVGDVLATVEATGTLEPVRRVEVGPEVSGRIVAVHADYNDLVEEGQILVEIDPLSIEAQRREVRARLQLARAGMRRAIAARDDARRTVARFRALAGTGAIAEREHDAAEAAVLQTEAGVGEARAQIALAQASLSSIETNLARTSIRSPVDGIVLERRAEPGQSVAATFQPPILFVLAEDLANMELRLAVDEADIGRVGAGQIASFTVDAFDDRTFEGGVTSVRNAPRTVQGVVTYEVIVAVDNREHLLRPGMTASANVNTAREDRAMLVPNAAMRFTPPGHEAGDGDTVWVRRDGSVAPVHVTRGIDDGRHTAVTGPLEIGDELLIDVVQPED